MDALSGDLSWPPNVFRYLLTACNSSSGRFWILLVSTALRSRARARAHTHTHTHTHKLILEKHRKPDFLFVCLFWGFFFCLFCFVFETGFLCIALAVLELVDQAGLELRNPPASDSRVLRLKVCTTTPDKEACFKK